MRPAGRVFETPALGRHLVIYVHITVLTLYGPQGCKNRPDFFRPHIIQDNHHDRVPTNLELSGNFLKLN